MSFYTASANKISSWRGKLSRFLANGVFFQNEAKNAGRSRINAGLRERESNAGFPAGLLNG